MRHEFGATLKRQLKSIEMAKNQITFKRTITVTPSILKH